MFLAVAGGVDVCLILAACRSGKPPVSPDRSLALAARMCGVWFVPGPATLDLGARSHLRTREHSPFALPVPRQRGSLRALILSALTTGRDAELGAVLRDRSAFDLDPLFL